MMKIDKVYTAKDMRAAAKCLFASEVNLAYDKRDISRMLRQAADMMDRADGKAEAKLEREAGTEAAQICGEIGEMAGRESVCHQPVTCCHALNAAAMRDALENIVNMGEQIDYQLGSSDETVYAFRHERSLAHSISECARTALSAPPRNCDRQLPAESVSADDVEQAWIEFKRCIPDVYFDAPGLWRFIVWLFSEAKGSTDGGN